MSGDNLWDFGCFRPLLMVYFGAGLISVSLFVSTVVLPVIAAFFVAHAGSITVTAATAIIMALINGEDPIEAAQKAGIKASVGGMFADMMEGFKEIIDL